MLAHRSTKDRGCGRRVPDSERIASAEARNGQISGKKACNVDISAVALIELFLLVIK